MPDHPPLVQPIWDTLSPEAEAAVSELVDSFERRVAALQEQGRRFVLTKPCQNATAAGPRYGRSTTVTERWSRLATMQPPVPSA